MSLCFDLVISSRIGLIQCRDVEIAVALHFQSGGFLADYAAMQQSTAIFGVAATTEALAGTPVSQPADTTLSTLTPVNSKPSIPVEVGGRDGPEPTRFGDWEKAGRCIDF
jgi:hypothetical protein